MLKPGVCTTLRRLFAFFEVDECNGDLSTVNLFRQADDWPPACGDSNELIAVRAVSQSTKLFSHWLAEKFWSLSFSCLGQDYFQTPTKTDDTIGETEVGC